MPSLKVNSNVDSQILLIGGDLKLVRKGLGTLSADLPAGFYKLKAERGGGTVERLVELTQDETVPLFVQKFPAIAPLQPLLDAESDKVERIGQDALSVPAGAPPEPGLLVLAHRLHEGEVDANPFAGLKIAPWEGGSTVELSAQPLHQVSLSEETWRAAWLPLSPGCHVFEIVDAGQTVQQAIRVASDWQTRLFIKRSRWHGRSEAHRLEWVDVSIQMARRSDPVVYSDHLEIVEVARNALELNRPIIVSNHLINSLLLGKFENPMAGITGLHLFLEALERTGSLDAASAGRELQIDSDSRASADDIVRQGIDNLERLLCRSRQDALPSDLLALKARAGLLTPADKKIVIEPPMLWVSWDILRKRCGPDQPIEISADLWKRIAWASAWGPYLAWPTREATVEKYVEGQLRGRRDRVNNSRSKLELLDGDELTRALNIPSSLAPKA